MHASYRHAQLTHPSTRMQLRDVHVACMRTWAPCPTPQNEQTKKTQDKLLPLIPGLRRQKQADLGVKASLVYILRSANQGNDRPCLKIKDEQTNQTGHIHLKKKSTICCLYFKIISYQDRSIWLLFRAQRPCLVELCPGLVTAE